jgi:hypothetical protein
VWSWGTRGAGQAGEDLDNPPDPVVAWAAVEPGVFSLWHSRSSSSRRRKKNHDFAAEIGASVAAESKKIKKQSKIGACNQSGARGVRWFCCEIWRAPRHSSKPMKQRGHVADRACGSFNFSQFASSRPKVRPAYSFSDRV